MTMEFVDSFSNEKQGYLSPDFFVERNLLCQKTSRLFKHSMIFGRNGKLYTTVVKKITPEELEQTLIIINQMYQEFAYKYHIHYHFVVIPLPANFISQQAFYGFEQYTLRKAPLNKAYRITSEDIANYQRRALIIDQLADIQLRNNLNDARVLPYCQPILDVTSQKYFTAESLMRLDLPGFGVIYPNEFIPIAEDLGMIHTLSMIMLNKVCQLAN